MPKTLLLKIVVYACISVCYYSHSILHAQNGYVLSEDAIESFDLMVQANYCWPLSADSFTDSAIRQKWQNSEKEVYYILYCEFENEALALQGTEYMANSCALPFVEGSPTDGNYGGNAWVAVDSSAVCFQTRKYGIKIFKPINFQRGEMKKLEMFSDHIIKQIQGISMEE